MNERIRQLEDQASQYASRETTDSDEWEFIFRKKFAELIVQECTNYMNSRTEDWDAKLRWIFNDGSGYMEVDVGSILKEHFEMSE